MFQQDETFSALPLSRQYTVIMNLHINSRKTERGAKQSLTGPVVRPSQFALSQVIPIP